jgi:hypothetical protein
MGDVDERDEDTSLIIRSERLRSPASFFCRPGREEQDTDYIMHSRSSLGGPVY